MRYVGDRIEYLTQERHETNYNLYCPNYHRAAIGLFPGTRVFLIPVPRSRELLVSPIKPDNWGDLWKLEVALQDIPGSVNGVLETLMSCGVNVLVQEGLSDWADEQKKTHQLSLILDLNRYDDPIDRDTDHRNHVNKPRIKPNNLLNRIISDSASKILLTADGQDWDLSMTRMRAFYDYKAHRADMNESVMIGHNIQLPAPLIQRDIYQGQVPEQMACHVISDTEEKYLKIKFLFDKKYLLLGIEHKEEVGAIFRFTQILAKKRINIINSYSRISSMDRSAVWNCFLEMPPRFSPEDAQEVCKLLEQEDFVTAFFLRGDYGFSFPVLECIQTGGLAKFSGLILAQDERRPKAQISGSDKKAPDAMKRSALMAEALGLSPFYSGRDWRRKENHVFVAMPFDELYEEFYADHIEQTLSKNGLRAVRVDKLRASDPSADVMHRVREELACCDFVVADVTGSNPNVLYEVGLAHAIGKKVLIIKEGSRDGNRGEAIFDLNQKSHLFYSPYKLKLFDREFEARVKAIQDGGRRG